MVKRRKFLWWKESTNSYEKRCKDFVYNSIHKQFIKAAVSTSGFDYNAIESISVKLKAPQEYVTVNFTFDTNGELV